LWGASFPLALAAVASKDDDPGRLVGGIYAANTAGAIVGALAFSVILIPRIGTQNCERTLIVIAAVSALGVLGPYVWNYRATFAAALLVSSIVGAGYLVVGTAAVPPSLIAYGRRFLINLNTSEIPYVG